MTCEYFVEASSLLLELAGKYNLQCPQKENMVVRQSLTPPQNAKSQFDLMHSPKRTNGIICTALKKNQVVKHILTPPLNMTKSDMKKPCITSSSFAYDKPRASNQICNALFSCAII
jgi:hypothetical protein